MNDSIEIEQLGVFQVFTGGDTGSGFLIKPNTLVTNCHVVAPYRTVAVELRDKSRVVGIVRRIHPRRRRRHHRRRILRSALCHDR